MFKRFDENSFHLGANDKPDLLVTYYTPTGFGSLTGAKAHWKVRVINSFKYSGPEVATVQWGASVVITERATGIKTEISYSWRQNLLAVKVVAATESEGKVIQLDAGQDKVAELRA